MPDRTILHCDINNFYASVEICKNSSLRGLPIAVTGDPEKRHGIILAKSYPAKEYGIKTGEAIWEAKKKCPKLILLPADYSAYMAYSDRVFDIYTRFTDRVESYGLDECWLDVTGSEKLFGNGKEIADKLREELKLKLGLTISVGVSFTKAFAKLGSDMKKPDATTVILKEDYKTKVWPLPVEDLIMVGRKTALKLNKYNIMTIGDLAMADRELIGRSMGVNGLSLIDSANGVEDGAVRYYYESEMPKSVGHSTTTPRDILEREEIKAVVIALSDQIAYRLRKLKLLAGGVSLFTRNNRMENFGRQCHLDLMTDNGKDIAEKAMKLYDELFDKSVPLRLVGVSTFNIIREQDNIQTSLFDDEAISKTNLDRSLDSLREKYGIKIIRRGVIHEKKDISDIFSDEEFLPFKR